MRKDAILVAVWCVLAGHVQGQDSKNTAPRKEIVQLLDKWYHQSDILETDKLILDLSTDIYSLGLELRSFHERVEARRILDEELANALVWYADQKTGDRDGKTTLVELHSLLEQTRFKPGFIAIKEHVLASLLLAGQGKR